MQKRIPIKNHHQEIYLTARRSMIALGFLCLLILLLIFRLAYLQIYKQDVYETLATQNWLDLVPIEPTRGLIYDRNGLLLAENVPVFSLDVIPMQVTDLNKTLTDIQKIIALNDNDITQFKKQLKQYRRFEEIPLKLRLTEEEVARFTENQHRFPGVMVKARLMRFYPYGDTFSHVMGYVGRINTQELSEIDPINYSASHYIGKLGVEKYYEEELHGKVGYEQVENDASGKSIRILKEISGTPGKNIYLTVDSGLQFAAEKALGEHNGAIVVIQPPTGQVLAMVSKPGYDPNAFVLGISQKDFQALQQAESKPLFNRALRGTYPFASTIKPYFALQGLETGFATTDFAIYDQGTFTLANSAHIFHDWVKRGHGRVDISRAITVSCDIYFYQLANRMGIKRMDAILTQFGFGAPSGIDLDDELPGVVASPEWKRTAKGMHWFNGDTLNSAIGQGFMQTTPLQLAAGVSTLANRGQRFMPYLLLGEQLPGKEYSPQQPIPLDPVVLQNKEAWDIVIDAMEDVIASPQGTAYKGFGHNFTYTVAGKTGTAAVVRRRNADEEDKQENMPEKFRDHNLFIAFAPVENPQIALAIVTEHSHLAAETARMVFDYYFNCIEKRKNSPANAPMPEVCNVIPPPSTIAGTQSNANRQPEIEAKKASA